MHFLLISLREIKCDGITLFMDFIKQLQKLRGSTLSKYVHFHSPVSVVLSNGALKSTNVQKVDWWDIPRDGSSRQGGLTTGTRSNTQASHVSSSEKSCNRMSKFHEIYIFGSKRHQTMFYVVTTSQGLIALIVLDTDQNNGQLNFVL